MLNVAPSLFLYLAADIHPIATELRICNQEDQKLTTTEIKKLLAERIIESSDFPGRAQVVICKSEEKKHMDIDFSQPMKGLHSLMVPATEN